MLSCGSLDNLQYAHAYKQDGPVWYLDSGATEHKLAFVKGKSNDNLVIEFLDGKTIVTSPLKLEPCDPRLVEFYKNTKIDTLSDCAGLQYLTYSNIIENLKQRLIATKSYKDKNGTLGIYTYASSIMLLLNPYQKLEVYNQTYCEKYFESYIRDCDPHPFAFASTAYEQLIKTKKSQYILVNGESGSGKTECTKHILRYLTWVSSRKRKNNHSILQDDATRLSYLLLRSNPLLEFFGNAKTHANKNSSRFGKLFKLYFNDTGDQLIHCDVDTYLLAKGRSINCPKNEQNYHVFYSLAHAPASFQHKYIKTIPEHWKLLKSDSTEKYDDPSHDFYIEKLIDHLHFFDVSDATIDSIFNVLYGILYMGEVEFIELNGALGARVVDDLPIEQAAVLWGLEGRKEELIQKFTSVAIADSFKPLSAAESLSMVQSVCMDLYESLFDYVVRLIKRHLSRDKTYGPSHSTTPIHNAQKILKSTLSSCTTPLATWSRRRSSVGVKDDLIEHKPCIAVLDLFGFENSINGLEQFCINYANEHLQQYFVQQFAIKELELYKKEGIIPVESTIPIVSNSDSLNLLAGSHKYRGIMNILEDCCRLSRDANQFCAEVNAELVKFNENNDTGLSSKNSKKNIYLCVNKNATSEFIIPHYAQPVVYNATEFIKRNTDYISADLRKLLLTSSAPVVKSLLSEDLLRDKRRTVSSSFKYEINQLISTLKTVDCFFIKCIKPNATQSPFKFDYLEVKRQLITVGISPMLEILKNAFSCRLAYNYIYEQYCPYFNYKHLKDLTPIQFVKLLFSTLKIPPGTVLFGKTQAFFEFGTLALLQDQIINFKRSSSTSDFFRRISAEYYSNIFLNVVISKMFCQKLHQLAVIANKKKEAVLRLQRWWRSGGRHRMMFLRTAGAVRYIQRWWRYELKRRVAAAIVLAITHKDAVNILNNAKLAKQAECEIKSPVVRHSNNENTYPQHFEVSSPSELAVTTILDDENSEDINTLFSLSQCLNRRMNAYYNHSAHSGRNKQNFNCLNSPNTVPLSMHKVKSNEVKENTVPTTSPLTKRSEIISKTRNHGSSLSSVAKNSHLVSPLVPDVRKLIEELIPAKQDLSLRQIVQQSKSKNPPVNLKNNNQKRNLSFIPLKNDQDLHQSPNSPNSFITTPLIFSQSDRLLDSSEHAQQQTNLAKEEQNLPILIDLVKIPTPRVSLLKKPFRKRCSTSLLDIEEFDYLPDSKLRKYRDSLLIEKGNSRSSIQLWSYNNKDNTELASSNDTPLFGLTELNSWNNNTADLPNVNSTSVFDKNHKSNSASVDNTGKRFVGLKLHRNDLGVLCFDSFIDSHN